MLILEDARMGRVTAESVGVFVCGWVGGLVVRWSFVSWWDVTVSFRPASLCLICLI